MAEQSLSEMRSIVESLESISSAASKFGPFFFAVLFTIVVPIVISYLISNNNGKQNLAFNKAYLVYLRYSVFVGLGLSLVGAGWWIYAEHRDDRRTRDLVAELSAKLDAHQSKRNVFRGLLIKGVSADDVFHQDMLSDDYSVSFMKVNDNWQFIIVSKDVIPEKIFIPYSKFNKDTKLETPRTFLEVRIQGKPGINNYSFEFKNNIAYIQVMS